MSNNDTSKDNNKKQKRQINLIRFLILIIIILILLLILATCSQVNNSDIVLQSNIRFEEDNPWDGIINNGGSTGNSEQIKFPGYTELIVKEGQVIPLGNPDGNTVTMVYSISKDSDTFYISKEVKPGNKVDICFSDYLNKGTHNLAFSITTWDLETGVGCNSAYMPVKVILE